MTDSNNKTRLKLFSLNSDNSNNDQTRTPHSNTSNNADTRLKETNNNKSSSNKTHADTTKFKNPKKIQNTSYEDVEENKQTRHSFSNVTSDIGHHGVLKGRFILAKIIGSGGMGVVYKAKDLLKVEAKDRDPYVAIKVLSEEFKSHPEAFISLQRESRKSQRIAHPNIVNVFDFDRDGDVVFMTMEYMSGRPLDKLIRQYKSTGLPSDDAWNILKSICSALIHAHSENIIHSDFKPGNIFVTNSGVTKVFDFGIARAVAKVTKFEGDIEDRTVFDAGNLGALTPAYASLEMLEGETPDARDDIYALGCIAYEVFSGRHPFNKVPADEAKRQGLVPERLNNITKRQWLTIKKALEFKRKDRIASVEDFTSQLTKTIKRSYFVPIIFLFISIFTVSVYIQLTKDTQQGLSESEMRSKVEYELQMDFHKKRIESLIKAPIFTVSWEDQVWQEYSAFNAMIFDLDKWVSAVEKKLIIEWMDHIKNSIYILYLDKIKKQRLLSEFNHVEVLMKNATRYTEDYSKLDEEKRLLAIAIKLYKDNKNIKVSSREKTPRLKITVPASKKRKIELFNIALKNVNQQLRCQSKLNMRNISVAVKKLKSYDFSKYKKIEPGIIKKLGQCINTIGKSFPKKAKEYKRYALRIFNKNKAIASIVIIPRDPCNKSLAGLGGRGKRTVCKDNLKSIAGGVGPDLIVVIGSGGIDTFALGKYEVSISEINKFCNKTKSCIALKSSSTTLPATNISFNVAKSYLKWLSQETGKKYRLPTKNEWLYAAKAKDKLLDPNRNCLLNTRGIEKGEVLFDTSIGKPNSWGMVNYVGNAREWVYAKGRKLESVGGAYNTPMVNCNFEANISSNGSADKVTSFRVLREIKN